jgi:hypothetical protein
MERLGDTKDSNMDHHAALTGDDLADFVNENSSLPQSLKLML